MADLPRRDARRIDPVRPPKPRARKDRLHWCKGRVGIEHVWRVMVPSNVDGFFATRPCIARTYATGDGRQWSTWLCKHRVVCVLCGKEKRRATRTECASGVVDPPRESS